MLIANILLAVALSLLFILLAFSLIALLVLSQPRPALVTFWCSQSKDL